MRTDEKIAAELDSTGMVERRWKGDETSGWMEEPGGEISLSISGYERNRLFLGAGGSQFRDLSGVSGLDALTDGRAFALTDYDRDGWQDVAAVNTNAPLLQLFRNDIAERGGTGNVVALRFSGGNHSSGPSGRFGPRDGYGAKVTVTLGATELLREHRCGEGLAAQNSPTLLVGIGDRAAADAVEVRWPGGTVQRTGPVPAGTLLTVFENPARSPTGEAFVAERYPGPAPAPPAGTPRKEGTGEFSLPSAPGSAGAGAELRMYTSTATWCPSCKASLPQLRALRDAFTPGELEMTGVPVDPGEGEEKLAAYAAKYQPAYRLRTDLSPGQAASFSETLARITGIEALPSTLITAPDGTILIGIPGVPTISEIRSLLRRGRTGG